MDLPHSFCPLSIKIFKDPPSPTGLTLGWSQNEPIFTSYFEISVPFFLPERLHCCYIYFHCSYLYSYYSSFRTLCIQWWDSECFVLRFSKISLLYGLLLKEGWKEAQRLFGWDKIAHKALTLFDSFFFDSVYVQVFPPDSNHITWNYRNFTISS